MEPVFTVINWDNKVFELNGKGIDVVWNGMTITTAAQEAMEYGLIDKVIDKR